ncbi:rlpA-like protein [Filimonas sp.]|nr:rlpA-like protein [Filimonas sp.]
MLKLLLFVLLLLPTVSDAQAKKSEWTGTASYYHPKFNGRKTSSGDIFSNEKLTAASNILKFGTKVKVTNLRNQKSVDVIINDHMHGRNKRLIDVSAQAAKALGFYDRGICKVRVELISENTKTSE